jgi:hypothetical protein
LLLRESFGEQDENSALALGGIARVLVDAEAYASYRSYPALKRWAKLGRPSGT